MKVWVLVPRAGWDSLQPLGQPGRSGAVSGNLLCFQQRPEVKINAGDWLDVDEIPVPLDFSEAGSINRTEAVVPPAAPATISGGPRWVMAY